MKMYARFVGMIVASVIAMFCMMYFNVLHLSHVFFSETMLYMAIMMGAGMGMIMLGFMWHMVETTQVNAFILGICVVMFFGGLWLVRSQATINDVDWLKGMIPHHSMAVLTSSRADLDDPRVRALAERIIVQQESEIVEMKALIKSIREGHAAVNP